VTTSLSFYLVGPGGEQVAVVPADQHARNDDCGPAVFHVPYALEILYPGTWTGLVADPSGVHQFEIEIPEVRSSP
jgi:hypothetical protein